MHQYLVHRKLQFLVGSWGAHQRFLMNFYDASALKIVVLKCTHYQKVMTLIVTVKQGIFFSDMTSLVDRSKFSSSWMSVCNSIYLIWKFTVNVSYWLKNICFCELFETLKIINLSVLHKNSVYFFLSERVNFLNYFMK